METIIISLGGSTIVPDKIDIEFLKAFRKLILSYPDNQFAIYCGGGSIARKYQNAAGQITELKNHKLDWLGIEATKLNANLMKTIFSGYCSDNIIIDPTKKLSLNDQIIIAAGWKPGWSTDYDAVLLAENIGAKKVINITNIDHVYTKDPKKFSDAKPIKTISWHDFRKIVGDEWDPGLNAPFDPIAAKQAEKLGLKVVITNGNIDNLKNILDNKGFIGTVIQ